MNFVEYVGIKSCLYFVILGTYGYVISVVSVEDEDIQAGLIDIDTGAVNVSVFYTVILLRPFKNEVLDAVGKSRICTDLRHFYQY